MLGRASAGRQTAPCAMMGGMGARRKRAKEPDPLADYRRIRKPMPPPERVIPDRRDELREREAEREVREADRDVEEAEEP